MKRGISLLIFSLIIEPLYAFYPGPLAKKDEQKIAAALQAQQVQEHAKAKATLAQAQLEKLEELREKAAQLCKIPEACKNIDY